MLSISPCSDVALPTLRPLTAKDVEAYRALRQKVLAIGDGRYFSDSYTREAQLNDNPAWRNPRPHRRMGSHMA